MVPLTTWAASLFFAGGILTLERRCLGRMAFVQPLALCILAGALIDQPLLGLWLGVVLQVFSTIPGNQADWALTGIITSGTILIAHYLGIPLIIGGPGVCAIIVIAMLFGGGARQLDRTFAKTDGDEITKQSPLLVEKPVRALGGFIRRKIGRAFLLGGVETFLGTAIATTLVFFAKDLVSPEALSIKVGIIGIPVIAVAAAIGALAGYRVIILAGVSMAALWVVIL